MIHQTAVCRRSEGQEDGPDAEQQDGVTSGAARSRAACRRPSLEEQTDRMDGLPVFVWCLDAMTE
jgi:hypothetical protein